MFGIFKKKTPIDKLNQDFRKLMKEANELSSINRKMSDQKIYEANEILKAIEHIETKVDSK